LQVQSIITVIDMPSFLLVQLVGGITAPNCAQARLFAGP